jgi:hypothetical protein
MSQLVNQEKESTSLRPRYPQQQSLGIPPSSAGRGNRFAETKQIEPSAADKVSVYEPVNKQVMSSNMGASASKDESMIAKPKDYSSAKNLYSCMDGASDDGMDTESSAPTEKRRQKFCTQM